LGSDIRRHKETLMRNGVIEVTMPNSSRIKVTRDEFFATQPMKEFETLLRDTLTGVLAGADASWLKGLASFEKQGRNQISVVLTGGGAELPAVQNIANGRIAVHDLDFPLLVAAKVPAWIEDGYSALTRT
jgi:ABC-type xylose transport system substrate-binding protein